MTSVSLLTVWLVLSAAGIALVYRIGIYLERWSHATSVVCLVLLAPAALIGGCVAAHQVVRLDLATCEEMDPSVDRLSGMSPSEFRARCIATKNNSDWLALRNS
jgi:hypothetical protein